MAFPTEDISSDSRTVYAKPFPRSTTTEDYVKQIFGVFGSIRRVKLRREAPTNSFRGSVYVEFTEVAAALAAVANPPQAPPGEPATSPHRLHVMLKTEYERKRSHASASTRDGGGGGGGGVASSSRGHKRAKRRSDALSGSPSNQHHQELPPPPLPPPPLPPPPPAHNPQSAGDPTAATSLGVLQQRPSFPSQPPPSSQQTPAQPQQQSPHPKRQQQQPATAAAATAPASASASSHWRQVAEEREMAVRSLEEALRKEKKESQQLHQRLAEAQQRVQEAAAREAAANQKVLARDVEIGSLKGEISMLRTQGAAQLERQGASHKVRITELEASVQRLKDALMEKERGEREVQRKAAAAAAAAAAAKENGSGRRGGPSGSGSGGGRPAADMSLDEL